MWVLSASTSRVAWNVGGGKESMVRVGDEKGACGWLVLGNGGLVRDAVADKVALSERIRRGCDVTEAGKVANGSGSTGSPAMSSSSDVSCGTRSKWVSSG